MKASRDTLSLIEAGRELQAKIGATDQWERTAR